MDLSTSYQSTDDYCLSGWNSESMELIRDIYLVKRRIFLAAVQRIIQNVAQHSMIAITTDI
jgi:hypothetical protein